MLIFTLLSLVVFFPAAPFVFALWLLIGLLRMIGGWRCQLCGASHR